MKIDRRDFLLTVVPVGAAAVGGLAFTTYAENTRIDNKGKTTEEEISAPEDLMREHGILSRVLLIYEEGLHRLNTKETVSFAVFQKAATLVHTFIEGYHEKLEERYIFPPFEKRKKLVDLVTILRQQHEAGRKLTELVMSHATQEQFHKDKSRRAVVRACKTFIRMYRPHKAREDTVLFPAIYEVIGVKAVQELGEQFEKEERRLVGQKGFEETVEEVAAIEKQLNIYDLAGFTPQ